MPDISTQKNQRKAIICISPLTNYSSFYASKVHVQGNLSDQSLCMPVSRETRAWKMHWYQRERTVTYLKRTDNLMPVYGVWVKTMQCPDGIVTQTGCAVPPMNNGGKYSAISLCQVCQVLYFFFKNQSTWYICIRMEGLTICNGFVVKLLLFCTMVCLTSVCV